VAEVRAFRAIRYDERVAGPLSNLICPPYDVISSEQRALLEGLSPHNFVQVELPNDDAGGYASAAGLLRAWRETHVLRQDMPASLYVDDHDFSIGGARATRRGVFVALRLHELAEGVVLPHERTFPKAKADRLDLLRATRTNTSPVFGMVDAARAIEKLAAAGHDIARATLDGDTHRLRAVTNPDAIADFAAAVKGERVYIADGHHRYETALTYAAERHAGSDAPERFTLASLSALDDPGLRIFGTHRVIAGARAALDAAVARSFEASAIEHGGIGDLQPGIVMVRDGSFTRLEVRRDVDRSAMPGAWRELPVALAEELLVKAARDAGAEIAYEHDLEQAINAARGERTAVLIRAVDPRTLRAVSDAGERMPQKTTYFYPKVPAGLVIRTLDDDVPATKHR
jgi:uncharacterized protein (DUF1015 family)